MSDASSLSDRRAVGDEAPPRVLGRYTLHGVLASGGMATVHFGRLRGVADFSRIVAVKRLHPQFAGEPSFVAMFLDEARLAARIQHPNVVAPLDVAEASGELFVVFEYIHGDSLSKLLSLAAKRAPPPIRVVSAVVAGLLHGLHAAHEATGPTGEPLGIIHRDVSPQNVLVGVDGVPRLIDFGVAKARARLQTTGQGEIKGKLAYMAPEQLRGQVATRQSDVYAAGVVLWEALTGRRLFVADNEGAVIERVLIGLVDPPSTLLPEVPEALDALVLRALDRDPSLRFASARAMAEALEAAMPPAPTAEVAAWVAETAAEKLARRAERIARIELVESESSETAGRAFLAGVGAASDATPAPRARLGVGAIAIGAVGVTLLAVTVVARYSGAAADTSVLVREPPREPSAPLAAPTASPSVMVAEPIEAPAATASAAVAPSAASPATSPRASAPRPPLKPVSQRSDCKIPFTLDATGRKSYRRECL